MCRQHIAKDKEKIWIKIRNSFFFSSLFLFFHGYFRCHKTTKIKSKQIVHASISYTKCIIFILFFPRLFPISFRFTFSHLFFLLSGGSVIGFIIQFSPECNFDDRLKLNGSEDSMQCSIYYLQLFLFIE